MKKIVFLFILQTTLLLAQQVLPTESFYALRFNGGIPENYTDIRDVNNVLQRFVGNWKGNYEGKNYEVLVTRGTRPFRKTGINDILILRYKITSSYGTVIEQTLTEPNSADGSITGYYLQNRTYIFNYQGLDYNCGQSGQVYITAGYEGNPNKMGLHLNPEHILLDTNECPNGRAPLPFPQEMMWLYKQ